jgi:tetratricopeptide (TPR) repeat protein
MQTWVAVGVVWLSIPLAGGLSAAETGSLATDGLAPIARARSAFSAGRYAEADALYSSELRRADSAGIQGVRRARLLYELGAVRQWEGRCEEASDLIRRGIGILSAAPDPDREELSQAWQVLGTSYKCRFQYQDELHAFSQAWDLEAGLAIPNRGRQVEILTGMAAVYEHLGRDSDSAALFDRIQALAEGAKLEPLQQAFVFNNMGTLRMAARRFPEAEEILKRGVALAEKAAVPKDPALAYLLSNLGLTLCERKACQEAAPLFARSIELVDRGARVAPRDIPQLLRNYADCLRKTGQKQDARKLEARASALEHDLPPNLQRGKTVSIAQLASGR